ncbi:MAG: crossover junction endodeoxyribonuclease RuvC [Bacteroidetes bacterium]|nr:crossover junction endodeoxyribonuclease RuvC [Bacteroidota bacterium]
MVKEKIILGIDPGTNITGYGLIKSVNNKPELITLGIIKLQKNTTHFARLEKIFKDVLKIIELYNPDELAIEAPFFGKNVQSMLKLGRAQGVSIAAALSRSMPVFEYAPRKIKLAVTGNGAASKEQVSMFLQQLFKTKNFPKELDATDGLAAAVCHFYQKNLSSGDTHYSSWKSYISNNPNKIR